MLSSNELAGEVINIGTGIDLNIKHLAEIVKKKLPYFPDKFKLHTKTW